MRVLVTGGAGYIGSHVCVSLLEAGHSVVVFDNFENSEIDVVYRIEKVTGASIAVRKGDVRSLGELLDALYAYPCHAAIHLAGLKAVSESVKNPTAYYHSNAIGTLNVIRALTCINVKKIVFSSSATVYGEPQCLPIPESHALSPVNPYGRSKRTAEQILEDVYSSDASWGVAILRYFNPVGAHESGLIGESPTSEPENLMPIVSEVASGKRYELQIWGADYPTADGTGVRDFVHVMDLADGHVRALEALAEPKCLTVNLGSGTGYSVLELIRSFESVTGRPIRYSTSERRDGDVAACMADTRLAMELFGWSAKRSRDVMCADTWRWETSNRSGFEAQGNYTSEIKNE